MAGSPRILEQHHMAIMSQGAQQDVPNNHFEHGELLTLPSPLIRKDIVELNLVVYGTPGSEMDHAPMLLVW